VSGFPPGTHFQKTANRISPNGIGGIKEKYDFRFELGTTIWLYGSQLVLDTSTTGCDAVNSGPQRVVCLKQFGQKKERL
jgi:hypothetical protein